MADTTASRVPLHERLREAEERLVRLQEEAAAAAGERLPGTYLQVAAAGYEALLPAAQVLEILRLLAFDPIPGAPAAVLGSFSHRGAPVAACDLARWLGVEREPSLDAHVVVLATSTPVALVVDRVAGLVDGPEVLPAREADGAAGAVVALCRTASGVVPLLRLDGFVALARGAVA